MLSSSLGTIVRETSNFLVEEKVLASVQDSLTFNNLDGLADGGYTLDIFGVSGAATDGVSLYINGDTTAANYGCQYLSVQNTSPGAGQLARSYVGNIGDTGQPFYHKIDVSITNGRVTFMAYAGMTVTSRLLQVVWNSYNITVSNITSLLLTCSAFGTGTVARLYRKRQGLPSAFPSPQGMLVSDILVPANTTQLDIAGLNGDLHGGYELHLNLVAGGTSASRTQLNMFVNGDTTVSNYAQSWLWQSSSGFGRETWSQSVAQTYVQGDKVTSNIRIAFNSGRVFSDISINTVYAGAFFGLSGFHQYLQTVSNLTSLSFVSSQTNGIGAGSRFRLYRRL